MEEFYANGNPKSLGLAPESVIRRRETSLVAPSHFDDSNFEGNQESADQSDKEEVSKELII